MNRCLAICDIEETYVKRLMKYFNSSDKVPFEVHAFTSAESLLEYGMAHPIEVLLISVQAMEPCIKELKIENIILLADGNPIELEEKHPIVNKYQSSSSLVCEMMQHYMANQKIKPVYGTSTARVIGIAALESRCLLTSFSLATALHFGKREKLLYINLEEYSGLHTLFGMEEYADLSDLIYYFREKKEESGMRASLTAQRWEDIFIIPPARYPQDLRNVREAEWSEWLSLIAEGGGFETILVTFGNAVPLTPEFLSICQTIYMPVKSDWMASNKQKAFEDYCRIQEKEGFLSHIHKVHLPDILPSGKENEYRKFLKQGAFAEVVAKVIEEDVT